MQLGLDLGCGIVCYLPKDTVDVTKVDLQTISTAQKYGN